MRARFFNSPLHNQYITQASPLFSAHPPILSSSHFLRTRHTLNPLRPTTRSSAPHAPSRATSRSSSPTCLEYRHTSSNTRSPPTFTPFAGSCVQASSSVLDRGATRPTPGPSHSPTSASTRDIMLSNPMPIRSVTCISLPSSSHTGGLYVRHHNTWSTPR